MVGSDVLRKGRTMHKVKTWQQGEGWKVRLTTSIWTLALIELSTWRKAGFCCTIVSPDDDIEYYGTTRTF